MINLNQIKIASPCGESWEGMEGDNQQRFCKSCSKMVYNLTGMTEADGLALIARNEGEMCVRFRRRWDGTVMTADCPVGQARARKRRTVSFAWAISLIVADLYVMSRNAEAVQMVQKAASGLEQSLTPRSKLNTVAGNVAGGL